MESPGESPRSLFVVYPRVPIPGALAVVVPGARLEELRALEADRSSRVWVVRAVVADSIPLAGTLDEIISRAPRSGLLLNEERLTIYLHYGGERVVYYDLVGREDGTLSYIEVWVEAAFPNAVFLYGRRAVNELLDAILRVDRGVPLVVQRLELLSPRDGDLLAYEVAYPFDRAIRLGPLGGIDAWDAFAPYEAILREATTTSSPFYRLLCAYRAYEGTRLIRKWLKRQAAHLAVSEQLPGDPPIQRSLLEGTRARVATAQRHSYGRRSVQAPQDAPRCGSALLPRQETDWLHPSRRCRDNSRVRSRQQPTPRPRGPRDRRASDLL
jgi:hypothetical protein